MSNQHRIEKTPLEARQGVELFRMRYVLGISLALVVVLMVVAFLIWGQW